RAGLLDRGGAGERRGDGGGGGVRGGVVGHGYVSHHVSPLSGGGGGSGGPVTGPTATVGSATRVLRGGDGLVQQHLHLGLHLLDVLRGRLVAVEHGLDVDEELVVPLRRVGVVGGQGAAVVARDVQELLLVGGLGLGVGD